MINVLKINCGLQFYGLRIYVIMLPSSGFSVAHYLFVRKGRHRRESKNKKQETKRFSTFAVYRLRHSEKKTLLDSRI